MKGAELISCTGYRSGYTSDSSCFMGSVVSWIMENTLSSSFVLVPVRNETWRKDKIKRSLLKKKKKMRKKKLKKKIEKKKIGKKKPSFALVPVRKETWWEGVRNLKKSTKVKKKKSIRSKRKKKVAKVKKKKEYGMKGMGWKFHPIPFIPYSFFTNVTFSFLSLRFHHETWEKGRRR